MTVRDILQKMQENTDRQLGKDSEEVLNECMVISAIESTALDLETRPGDSELINALFRAFHTLKGSAGVVGRP